MRTTVLRWTFIGLILIWSPAAYCDELIKIPADPANGFSWAYYLLIPSTITSPPVLMVEPNNTGTSDPDPAVHDQAAKAEIQIEAPWANILGTPWLIPTFPRPYDDRVAYTHALDRNTLLLKEQGLVRIDLQLIAMVRDAQARLAARAINVDSKFFMAGGSAAGSFISRFVMLHPDVVKAASIGAPGWGPIVPVASWSGKNLPYPEGIADLDQLVGSKFDGQSFSKVPLQVWVGDEDFTMDLYWRPSDSEMALVSAAFGGTSRLYERWPEYEAAYNSVSSLCQFIVFPTLSHSWPDFSYLRDFFQKNRSAQPVAVPKPALYTIYFPHVASFESWETEVALTNASPVAVRGQLKAYGPDGGTPLQIVSLTLEPLQRKEITVGSFFQNPQNIAYLSFVSDSGFLAGYTRFSQPGNRVSLKAGTGTKTGWFTKMEQDGWTGIAFVNVDTSASIVKLAAMDANGNQVSSATLTLAPGKKVVGMVTQLFTGDLSTARYFKYTSDKPLLGFTVSGSSDGQMLDGLHCLPNYIFP
ncbi:MAG TPA: hypothetical protein VE398_20990 [Acidobacteriota bacterium]|nr:hypothetical protein [Acidobacteriota bacterium]